MMDVVKTWFVGYQYVITVLIEGLIENYHFGNLPPAKPASQGDEDREVLEDQTWILTGKLRLVS